MYFSFIICLEKDHLVQLLWSMNKDFYIPVAKVCVKLLMDEDIRSLRDDECLTDRVRIAQIWTQRKQLIWSENRKIVSLELPSTSLKYAPLIKYYMPKKGFLMDIFVYQFLVIVKLQIWKKNHQPALLLVLETFKRQFIKKLFYNDGLILNINIFSFLIKIFDKLTTF